MKKKICVVSGSRADWGLLQYPIKILTEDDTFDVTVEKIWNGKVKDLGHPDLFLVLGDRFEILDVVTQAHLNRIPVAHIAGGDITEGSYDDAMRDCISRMADIHFVTSTAAMARLTHLGYHNVHLVGNPGIDYIKHADWRKERKYYPNMEQGNNAPPIPMKVVPYVVINYQAETIDGTNEIESLMSNLDGRTRVFILPNPDRGSDEITERIRAFDHPEGSQIHEFLPHDEYLNLICHCDVLIGNSSSMLYEAPELGIKIKMIGKRQKGRTLPWGDGLASERMLNILKYCL